jgi:hypothetical protein
MKVISAIVLSTLSLSAYALDFETGVDASPRSSSCLINSDCIVATSHWGSVINRTATPRYIYISYEICPQNEECKKEKFKVLVRQGTWSDGKIISMKAKYHYYGDFYLDATTTITDEHHKVLSTLTNRGMIQVHG